MEDTRGGRRIQIIVYEYLAPKVNESKVKLIETDVKRPRQAIKELMFKLDEKRLMGLPIEYELEKEVPKGTLFAWLVGVKDE